jgi:hypothetical protein
MLNLAREQGLTPTWGPRQAVLYDVSVLGSFIARVMCNPPDPKRFQTAATSLVERAEELCGWLYETTGPDGTSGTIRHVVWSDVLICPACGGEITYWDACVRQAPLRLEKIFSCPRCTTFIDVNACKRVIETVVDHVLGVPLQRKVRVPVVVYGTTGTKNWKRLATPADMVVVDKASHEPLPPSTPITEIRWGDLYRSGYHLGISHLHHFYTPRNFLALSTIWRLVEDFDADLQDALRLLVLSFNASHSTLMTRVIVKKGQLDLVLTGAQSGVLYVSGLPVEKNIFKGLRRKMKTITEAFSTVASSRSSVTVVNGTSTALYLEDGSVDYVFTDPPFGNYIPYAEVNQINELWLGVVTKQSDEIIISPAQGKDVTSYGEMMRAVFSELSRVLRTSGRATVAFHSAKASVWQALIDAYSAAGLAPVAVSVLDKTQTSFKQAVSDVVVKGDPLILLSRVGGEACTRGEISITDIIASVLDEARRSGEAEERKRERLFSRFVARCLILGLPVTIDAGEFYRMARLDRDIA